MAFFENMLYELFGVKTDFETDYANSNVQPVVHHVEPANRTYEVGQKLSEKDGDFSTDDMLSYAEMVFLEIHKAVAYKELEPIRKLVSNRLYMLLKDLISDGQIDAIEEYTFDSKIEKNYITSYMMDDKYKYEYMKICIVMNIPTNDFYYQNLLTFRREVNKSLRIGAPITQAITCPNCGAALKCVTSTRCAYCNSVIEPATYEWELQNFEIIKR